MSAQKKEIAAARDQLKSGKNLQQAEKSMLKLLENPDNKYNAKIYRVLNAATQKQYEQINEQLYLKQSVDSAAMFLTLNRVYTYALMTDSFIPSERKENAEFLTKYLPNLYVGGMYLFKKEKYGDAFSLLDTYITSKNSNMLAGSDNDNQRLKPAAFRALCSGYHLKDYKKTVKYKDIALQFEPGNLVTMKYLTETFQKADSTYSQYIELLEEGVKKYPCDEYFFTRLLNYYLSNQLLEKALSLAESGINSCNEKALYNYAKSHILLNMEKYEECIQAANETLAISDSISECYYIAGMANVYLAEKYTGKPVSDKNAKKQMQEYYRKAMPYLETYRKREPQQQNKWASPLYTIYLNLNKGKEFDEISRILKSK